MFGAEAFLLLAVWSLGSFLPRIPAVAPVRPWPLPSGRRISPAALPARAKRSPAYATPGFDPPRKTIIRDRVGTSAASSSNRLDGGLAGRRIASIRLADAPSQGKVLDVRYVDQVYAQRRLECSSRRVCAWNDCGPASAAMLLHYEGLEPRDVLTNRQATLELVCETKLGCKGTTNRRRMLATLQNHGLEAYLVETPSLPEIRASIDRGHPVILSTTPWPDHVMVAVGYRPGDVVVVHDPYGGAFWWRHMHNINEPFTGHPERNGERVEYNYADLGPLVIYGLFTTGPAVEAGPVAPISRLSN